MTDPDTYAALSRLAEIAQEVDDEGAGCRLTIMVTNKHTDERRDLTCAFVPGELAWQIRAALRAVSQVEALVEIGRRIVHTDYDE